MSEQQMGSGARREVVAADSVATSVLSTLLAGPVVYGLLGWGLDTVTGNERLFLPIGVVVGIVFSFYIVYMRYGRSDAPGRGE
jgi:ATP synthase protein I